MVGLWTSCPVWAHLLHLRGDPCQGPPTGWRGLCFSHPAAMSRGLPPFLPDSALLRHKLRHEGAWRALQSSPLVKLSWLAELRVLGQPVGIMFQVPGFPWGLKEWASRVVDRVVRWPRSPHDGPGRLGQLPLPASLSFLVLALG